MSDEVTATATADSATDEVDAEDQLEAAIAAVGAQLEGADEQSDADAGSARTEPGETPPADESDADEELIADALALGAKPGDVLSADPARLKATVAALRARAAAPDQSNTNQQPDFGLPKIPKPEFPTVDLSDLPDDLGQAFDAQQKVIQQQHEALTTMRSAMTNVMGAVNAIATERLGEQVDRWITDAPDSIKKIVGDEPISERKPGDKGLEKLQQQLKVAQGLRKELAKDGAAPSLAKLMTMAARTLWGDKIAEDKNKVERRRASIGNRAAATQTDQTGFEDQKDDVDRAIDAVGAKMKEMGLAE